MFEELRDKTPAFERKGYEKVSELEILILTKDYFAKVWNKVGIESVCHFEEELIN